jgi:hypothetical protein
MKFLHELMPIFSTEFSEFPHRGLGRTYKTGFNFHHLAFKNTAQVIVPVFIEFTGLTQALTCLNSIWPSGRHSAIPDITVAASANNISLDFLHFHWKTQYNKHLNLLIKCPIFKHKNWIEFLTKSKTKNILQL